MLARSLKKRLNETLILAGLKNELGRVPALIFDVPLDASTRKLRLTKAGFTLAEFEIAKPRLQTSLQIYIDELKENLETGTIDVIYGHTSMPNHIPFKDLDSIAARHFVVGYTRSRKITASLKEVPHLMVAGISNGGKSTFLRQLIVTFYLRNPGSHFMLIDLKGGVEFQLFRKFKRIKVTDTVQDAIKSLQQMALKVDHRLKLLKLNNVKDIQAYENLPSEKRKTAKDTGPKDDLKPRFVIIDEAAEMFLAGSHASSQQIQSGRRNLSQIARQGRAVGVHLVIATQRPDVKAIDSQVKANLGGVLCFHMANDASSITVLGNGRATDLPVIPGRAIWKMGAELIELQTPFLSPAEAETLLAEHAIPEGEREKEVDQDESPSDSPAIETLSSFPDLSATTATQQGDL